MEFIDRLRALADRIPAQREHLQTEEATKNALVMPFIQALGYDVFNPLEVVPEFTADVGTKKGEKADYAIMQDGKPAILIECKTAGRRLDVEHASQLYRYFSVTAARVGILTDGIQYRFFSDLDEQNKMDSRPFLEFSLEDIGERLASELKRFTKDAFDLDQVIETASDLKYRRGIKRVLSEEWTNPSEDLVRLLAGRVFSGRMTQAVRAQFEQITKQAFHEFLAEKLNQRLKSAMESEGSQVESPEDSTELVEEEAQGIVTTEDELEAFYIVRAILADTIDPKRIYMRDRLTYCGILLDDNNRKTICRLRFGARKMYVGIFDESRIEAKEEISQVQDIYSIAEKLRGVAARLSAE